MTTETITITHVGDKQFKQPLVLNVVFVNEGWDTCLEVRYPQLNIWEYAGDVVSLEWRIQHYLKELLYLAITKQHIWYEERELLLEMLE